MIKNQKAKYGWESLFIGANIDAVETAKHIGISEDRAVNHLPDQEGTRVLYNGEEKEKKMQRIFLSFHVQRPH